MELDEMKNLWEEMSQKIEKQELLTDQLIMDMTKEKYTNKFRKISTYESIGSIICLGAAVYLLTRLGELDTWYLLGAGIISATILIALPILSLTSISAMKNVNIVKNDYKQVLIDFARSKQRFLLIQRVAILLGGVLMVFSLPVVTKIKSGNDLFLEGNFWYYLPFGFILFFLFARWGYTCYKNVATSAGHLLEELEE